MSIKTQKAVLRGPPGISAAFKPKSVTPRANLRIKEMPEEVLQGGHIGKMTKNEIKSKEKTSMLKESRVDEQNFKKVKDCVAKIANKKI